jgi:hypothetical protein
MSGAQAADLPVKAKPVEYVKICSLYGVGFYYIPGTDVCLKVGGWARFETGLNYNGSFTDEWWNNDLRNRTTKDNPWRVKGNITLDARSPTEYGTVRSYIDVGLSSNINGDDGAQTATYANRWFIQWAGFTIGHSTSFFDFYTVGGNQYGFAGASSDTGDGGWTVFGYTAQFGNGLSASLSAESQRRTQIINVGLSSPSSGFEPGTEILPIATAVGTNYQGQGYPDVIGNLRVDQAWGSAQVMGALHNVAATYYGTTAALTNEDNGHPNNALGFALGAGIKINAPMIGPGDYFQIEGDYTQGASRYSNNTATAFDWSMYKGNNFGWGYETDAVYGGIGATGSALELTNTWAVNAGYTHNWNAAWKSTLWGSYRAVSYDSNANNMICDAAFTVNAGSAAVPVAGCNMDWSMWGAGLRTQWAVSSTFQIGLEVMYTNLQSATIGQAGGAFINLPANSTKPGGAYVTSDMDNWAARFRVNRDFYP